MILALSLDTSLLEADDTLVRSELTLVIVACALPKARFASVKLEVAAAIDWFAIESAVLALDWTFDNAEVALVTARLATVTLEKAATVATLALWTTTLMVEDAELWADLMPFEADIDACCSCWEKVAFSAIIVLEISTVALLTEAMMRLEQSWGLFCRSSSGTGELVISALWGLVSPEEADSIEVALSWLGDNSLSRLRIIWLSEEFSSSSLWKWPAIKYFRESQPMPDGILNHRRIKNINLRLKEGGLVHMTFSKALARLICGGRHRGTSLRLWSLPVSPQHFRWRQCWTREYLSLSAKADEISLLVLVHDVNEVCITIYCGLHNL